MRDKMTSVLKNLSVFIYERYFSPQAKCLAIVCEYSYNFVFLNLLNGINVIFVSTRNFSTFKVINNVQSLGEQEIW